MKLNIFNNFRAIYYNTLTNFYLCFNSFVPYYDDVILSLSITSFKNILNSNNLCLKTIKQNRMIQLIYSLSGKENLFLDDEGFIIIDYNDNENIKYTEELEDSENDTEPKDAKDTENEEEHEYADEQKDADEPKDAKELEDVAQPKDAKELEDADEPKDAKEPENTNESEETINSHIDDNFDIIDNVNNSLDKKNN